MQIILFTNKDETPAVFRALAANGHSLGFRFADVHESEQELLKEFNIKKVRQVLGSWNRCSRGAGADVCRIGAPYSLAPVQVPAMQMVLALGGKARIQPVPGFPRYKKMYEGLQDIAKLLASMRSGRTIPAFSPVSSCCAVRWSSGRHFEM